MKIYHIFRRKIASGRAEFWSSDAKI